LAHRLEVVFDSVAGKVVIGVACLYAILGWTLIHYTGIELDEALFATTLYAPFNRDYGVRVFHQHIPLMVFPYSGSLKTLMYWPILRVFGPSALSLRLPVVILGAITVILFFKLAVRMAGARAAFLGAVLLATDASFILTNNFDWGPVAVQHFLMVAGCLFVSRRRPVCGCFCFGLALWNKAIFAWALAGLAAAVVAAYLPEVRRLLANRRAVALCACAFVAGALPLIVYNFHVPNATLHANVHLSVEDFRIKISSLNGTLNGSALFGIVVAPESEEKPRIARSAIGRLACWIRDRIGPIHSSPFVYAILFALLAAPLWWHSANRSAAIFAIVFSVVAFLAMAITRYTGGAHHVVLLYPMPQLLVAVAVGALRPKWLAIAAGTALVAANLLVVNQYVAQFERNGSYGFFTDALYPLSESLANSERRTIYALDFGMEDNLNLLHEGRLNVRRAWHTDSKPDDEIETMISNESALFISHVLSREYFKGTDDRLQEVASANGYERRNVRTVLDSNGRPQFDVFRFERVRESH
jgi:4-amino-4-deoxy-L-arabinose transferase-like glycosyltransferase